MIDDSSCNTLSARRRRKRFNLFFLWVSCAQCGLRLGLLSEYLLHFSRGTALKAERDLVVVLQLRKDPDVPLQGSTAAHSWDLADGLMHTLSNPLPPDSPAAATRTVMMEQIQADAARALISSSSPDTMLRAMRLLTGFPALGGDLASSSTCRPSSHKSSTKNVSTSTSTSVLKSVKKYCLKKPLGSFDMPITRASASISL